MFSTFVINKWLLLLIIDLEHSALKNVPKTLPDRFGTDNGVSACGRRGVCAETVINAWV
jgi:hypothetical protein